MAADREDRFIRGYNESTIKEGAYGLSDWENKENLKKLQQLSEEGFRFEYGADSYAVWYNEEYISGAGIGRPREKPLHYKHRDANIKDNREQCVITAERWKQKNLTEASHMTESRTITFEAWMYAVDQRVEARAGLSVHDLDDCPFMDWYEAGMNAIRAADKAIKNAGFGEGE